MNAIITTSRTNWTGEKVTVDFSYQRPGVWNFEVYDYPFQFTQVNPYSFEVLCLEDDLPEAHPIVKGYSFEDASWIATSGKGYEDGIVREDDSPFAAAVQVLSNII